jgi:hypothetical protein
MEFWGKEEPAHEEPAPSRTSLWPAVRWQSERSVPQSFRLATERKCPVCELGLRMQMHLQLERAADTAGQKQDESVFLHSTKMHTRQTRIETHKKT